MGSTHEKNRRPKISCYCPFNASFWFPLKQTIVNIVIGWFLKHPEPRKRDDKVRELAGDCRELRNCGSQILKVRNGSSATFFSPQFRNRFGSPQYCGIAEVRTKIADAHLCFLYEDFLFGQLHFAKAMLPCCMSLLHVFAACPCCMYVLVMILLHLK